VSDGPPPLPPRAALRWSLVRRIVQDLQPESILEIGMGMGGFGARLATLAPYTGVEPDPTSFETARVRIAGAGGAVHHGDHTVVAELPPFDLVCAFEVLEHIEDDDEALRDWMRLVRPGGSILLSVPAGPERFGPSDVHAGHYRRYTADGLRELLTAVGAAEVEVIHYAWPLGYLLDGVRNRLARGTPEADDTGTEERTRGSGRFLQPRSRAVGLAIRGAVAPFAGLQRLRPHTGPALVARARRPRG
jgi:SAM-dependent methyltransferase